MKLDCVLLGPPTGMLPVLCLRTGGLCEKPADEAEALALFRRFSFLSARDRHQAQQPQRPTTAGALQGEAARAKADVRRIMEAKATLAANGVADSRQGLGSSAEHQGISPGGLALFDEAFVGRGPAPGVGAETGIERQQADAVEQARRLVLSGSRQLTHQQLLGVMRQPTRTLDSAVDALLRRGVAGAAAPTAGGERMLRIQRELREMQQAVPAGIVVLPTAGDPGILHIVASGPDDPAGPYYKGAFRLVASIPAGYPAEPPVLFFYTPICHINVNVDGLVCHSRLKQEYSPNLSLSQTLLEVVSSLLLAPTPEARPEGLCRSIWRRRSSPRR